VKSAIPILFVCALTTICLLAGVELAGVLGGFVLGIVGYCAAGFLVRILEG